LDCGRYDEEGCYRRRWIHPKAGSGGNVDEETEDDDIEEEAGKKANVIEMK